MTTHVELRDVTKAYGDVVAVDDLSLQVNRGECLCLLGPSGCGKTTTLNLIAGFVRPDKGTISIGGQSVERKPPHLRNTGMVFQSYALFPHMSVFENIAFGLRMRRMAKNVVAPRVQKVLDLVRLSGFELRRPRELSGGQQQRVALARALVIEPTVLLLDEPLSSLDAKLRADMRAELVAILREVGITSIFVTHDQEEALSIADRIVVMNEGRVKEAGEPEEMYRRPLTPFGAGFLGASNLLPVTVDRVDADYVHLKDRSGGRIRVKAGGSWEVGDAAFVLIRPEQFTLRNHAEGNRNSIGAELIAVQFLGAFVRYDLRNPDVGPLIVTAPNATSTDQFEPGNQLVLEWEPDQCVLLRPDK